MCRSDQPIWLLSPIRVRKSIRPLQNLAKSPASLNAFAYCLEYSFKTPDELTACANVELQAVTPGSANALPGLVVSILLSHESFLSPLARIDMPNFDRLRQSLFFSHS